MRKLITAFLFIFFLSSYASAIMILKVTSAVCDDCTGATKFAWHFESTTVTSGSPCGCSDGDTTASTGGTPSLSTTQTTDGTYSMKFDSAGDNYSFTVSGQDLIDTDDWKFTFDLYIDALPAVGETCQVWRAYADATHTLQLYLYDNGDLIGWHKTDVNDDTVTIVPATGQWVSCTYEGKDGVAGNDHKLVCGAQSTEEDDDHSAMSSATTLVFGDGRPLNNCTFYMDNAAITVSDY